VNERLNLATNEKVLKDDNHEMDTTSTVDSKDLSQIDGMLSFQLFAIVAIPKIFLLLNKIRTLLELPHRSLDGKTMLRTE